MRTVKYNPKHKQSRDKQQTDGDKVRIKLRAGAEKGADKN